jgi:hypothetical protein
MVLFVIVRIAMFNNKTLYPNVANIVAARSNAGIMGSNPTQDMDICVYSVCLCCPV